MGKTIQESLQGSPYEDYGLSFMAQKSIIIGAEMAYLIDRDNHVPEKIEVETIGENGEKSKKMVTNPDSLESRLGDLRVPLMELDGPQQSLGKWHDLTNGISRIGDKFDTVEERDAYDKQADKIFGEVREGYDKLLAKNADNPDFLAFKDMFDFNMMTMHPEKGDFTQAMADSPYLASLHSQIGAMPNFRKYSMKELREALDGPQDPQTGKETKPLKLINGFYKSMNGLFELEYEKQRMQKEGYTPEQEKEYLGRLKTGMQSMVDSYDRLFEFESAHPGEYGTQYLNNELDHIIGVAVNENRGPHFAIGQLRGQIKAIDNGWGMDELTHLGAVGELQADLETKIRKDSLEIENTKNAETKKKLIEERQQSQSLLADLKGLDEAVTNRKVESAADKREVIDTLDEFVQKKTKVYPQTNLNRVYNDELKDLRNETKQKVKEQAYEQDYPKEWERKGISAEYGDAARNLSNAVDVYGPNPRHHSDWTDRAIIDKKSFDEKIKPYKATDLPFTETDLALMGMAYTSLNKPKNVELRKKTETIGGQSDRDLLDDNTFYTTDLLMHEHGPRENMVRFADIIANGRTGAKDVAEKYAAGDKKPLAELIQNGLRVSDKQLRTEAGLGSTSSVQDHAMRESFLGMLDRDPELRKEFDAVNASVPAADRVDLDKARLQLGSRGIAVAGFAAKTELDRKGDRIAPERREQLEKQVAVGKALYDIVRFEGDAGMKTAEYFRKQDVVERENAGLLRNPATAPEYSKRMERFAAENVPEKQAVLYFATEKGRKQLEEFAERGMREYGLQTGNNPTGPAGERYDAEIQKITADVHNENILARLSSGQELSENEMKQMTADYIRNATVSDKCAEFLKGGEKDPLAQVIGGKARDADKAQIYDYDNRLKQFVDNMDFKNMDSKELGELLQGGSFKEMTDQLYNSMKMENTLKDIQSGREKAPSLDGAVADLAQGKKDAWFGSKEYNKIFDDYSSLNNVYKNNEEKFISGGSKAVDPAINKKQEDLVKRMEDYQARKRKEFQDNKARNKADNPVSRARYNAVDKALKSLKERMDYNRKYDKMLEDSRDYKAYSQTASEMKAVDIETERAKSQANHRESARREPGAIAKRDAAILKQIDKDAAEFRSMSKVDYHKAGVYESQAAKVIAGVTVKQALENGDLEPGRLKAEYLNNQRLIEGNPAFQKWIKDAVENGRQSKLGRMKPEELQNVFVEDMAHEMRGANVQKAHRDQIREMRDGAREAKKNAKTKQPKAKKPMEKNELKA